MSDDRYEHGKKAGNEGDVVKHAFLLNIVDELISEDDGSTEPFWYVDTHVARPYHSLPVSGGWTKGIAKLRKMKDRLPGFLSEYLAFSFYEDKPSDMRRTAFSGLGTRLYLGSSALVFQRMRTKAAKRALWMTLFDIELDVVNALFTYYSDQQANPSLVCFDRLQTSSGEALAALWRHMGDSRHLIVKASSYDCLKHLWRNENSRTPDFVFIDPHKLGGERESIESILQECRLAGTRFLCWTPLMCVAVEGLSEDSWSWSQIQDGDEAQFVTWCKEQGFRLAWFAWKGVSGASQNTYGCQLTFDDKYDISRLRDRCEEMRSALHDAGIRTKGGSFRVRFWPE